MSGIDRVAGDMLFARPRLRIVIVLGAVAATGLVKGLRGTIVWLSKG